VLYPAPVIALVIHMFSVSLVPNGGFEDGLSGWGELWTREPDAGEVVLDNRIRHSGGKSARVEHTGQRDWSFDPNVRIPVQPGDVFELSAWLRIEGMGRATICVVTYDAEGSAVKWIFAERSLRGETTGLTGGWSQLKSRFVVPDGISEIHPRLIGNDPAKVWLDDFNLRKEKNVAEMRSENLPEKMSVENDILVVTLNTSNGTLSVLDRRIDRLWTQKPKSKDTVVLDAAETENGIDIHLMHAPSGADVTVILRLESGSPEITLEIRGEGDLPGVLSYPHPFVTESGTYLVVPMNEGISYPVEDESIRSMRLIAYGGHGICMGFWGVTDGEAGQMAIIETPDDMAIAMDRWDGNLCIAPEWHSQKGQFGYARRLRYVFLEDGGHVAMCKRYRRYAQETGLLKTLEEKRRGNPDVDLLIGAVNVWCWDRDALAFVREMKSLGIDRILWSHRGEPDTIRAMNEIEGVLTSRYDICQDVMDPAVFPKLRGVHSDWPTEAWPDDIMLDENGQWRKGWQVRGRDGEMYPCGVLCDKQALKYARPRIREELETHPYRCRFIDTTTASPWRECYHPDHPMTRSESRHWKMELLRLVSEEMNLVTGSETGHEAAVPYVHYFEGMLSLGPYRVPDAGRNMMKVWDELPDRVARFQMGHKYRLPLWELVYHDCVVAQWYWGDYNNKLPALWDKRDLFNMLYGTPPMFMFNRDIWEKNKERFAQSYKNVCPVARMVGYSEMTDHRFLTPDRDVQQTVFANGTKVTVNFGDKAYTLPDGTEVAPMGFRVQ
jgi:hypothetical protein